MKFNFNDSSFRKKMAGLKAGGAEDLFGEIKIPEGGLLDRMAKLCDQYNDLASWKKLIGNKEVKEIKKQFQSLLTGNLRFSENEIQVLTKKEITDIPSTTIISQYAKLPNPPQPSVSIGQYAQLPQQQSLQVQSNKEQYGQVPSSPPQQQIGFNVQQLPSKEAMELARIAAQQHLAKESYSFEQPRQPSATDLYSFEQPSQIPNQIYATGAVPPTSQYGVTPTPIGKPAFELDPKHVAPRPMTPQASPRAEDIYTVPDIKNEQHETLSLAKPTTGPEAPSNRPQSQFPQQGAAGLQQPNETIFKSSIDIDKYKGDDPKKFFSSGVDTGEYASTNQALFNRGQAEMSENLAQQRAASTPPQAPARTSAAASLASSAPPAIQIHQTPISADTRATYQPSSIVQKSTGASSNQTPAPEKRQFPTPPAPNAGQPRSPSIAERQAALFGGGRPVVGVATGRLSAAPKGSGLQK